MSEAVKEGVIMAQTEDNLVSKIIKQSFPLTLCNKLRPSP